MDSPVALSVPSVLGDGRVHQVPLAVRVRRAARRLRRTLFSDKVAAANVVMFIITAAIFLPAIGLMFLYIEDVGENQQTPTAGIHSRAKQALMLLTSSSGSTEAGTTNWDELGEPFTSTTTTDADGNIYLNSKVADPLIEVGILSDDSRRLDYAKIRMIQQGSTDYANNGFLDYPELKDALNIGDRFDLRLRSYPVVTTTQTNLYGSDPIKGKHVGYVAATTSEEIDLVTGAFRSVSTSSEEEMAALGLLDLTTDANSQLNGFDATWYQPCCTSTHNLDGDPLKPNNYVGVAAVQGDIIATSARGYYLSDPLAAEPYLDHFFDSYFKVDADTYRFDALVFGHDVDLTLWNTDKARTNLKAFLEAGKSIIFLGHHSSADDLVYGCAGSTDCLLDDPGGHEPFTTPDSTNAILTSPNELPQLSYVVGGGGEWPICDDERKGFIPVMLEKTTDPPVGCSAVQWTELGLTAGDRYDGGGSLILSAFNVTQGLVGTHRDDTAFFLSNLLNVAVLRSAYIDIGPALPDEAPVESSERILLLQLPDGTVLDLAIQLYMWRTG